MRRLKGNNNDLNAAVNEFFDDPAGEKYKYDESAFASDRDGTVNNAGISFQVQGPDDEGNRAPGYYSTAPSRPPSRSSNRSPFSNIISLAAEHAAADPTIKMTESEKVDPDLERALRESATEAGVPYSPPQQYGVTEGHTMEKYFGPANRTSYNHNEWAMVPGSSFATEILPDPDPEQRMRKPGTPAFLKPLVDDNRLPALLTIFHAIPLLREKLLCRDNILPDYGLNSEWWTGKTIEFTNSVVIVEESDALNEWGKPTKHNYDDYMREFQRLMAFLSDTERAYGSADALTHMVAYTQYPGHNFANDEDKALHAWEVACENIMKHKGAAANLFTVGVQPPDPSNTWGEPEESRLAFAVLDLELPTPDGADSDSETIYDLFDRKIWASSGLTADTTAFLPEVGEVISFRIKGEKSSKMIRVPSVWFPDRYLVENREVVANMRQAKENERGEMGPIDLKIKKLTDFTTPSGQTVKVKDILATCMRCDENKTSYEGQEEYEKAAPKTTLNLPEEFQKIMNNIDKKLECECCLV